MTLNAQIFIKIRFTINHQSVAWTKKADFLRNQSTVCLLQKKNERLQNEWIFFCSFFVCEQLYTLILIPFVLIKLVHINTMLYQLCFDIFWFIQLKTFRDIKTISQHCWLSDIRMILCSVSFWFMKAPENSHTHTSSYTYTQSNIYTHDSRRDKRLFNNEIGLNCFFSK